MENTIAIFWFRRDLRLEDNKGLYYALKENQEVLPLFIFDTDITDSLPENDARIAFIHNALASMQDQLKGHHQNLWVYKGKPLEIIKDIAGKHKISSVYTNMDHEPYGIERDKEVEAFLKTQNITFHPYLDHLLFHKKEVLKDDNSPYQVFTPYSKKCKNIIRSEHFRIYPSWEHISAFSTVEPPPFPTLSSLNFKMAELPFPDKELDEETLRNYHSTRDYPAQSGTSKMGVHLRFGTISIRSLANRAFHKNEVYFNELLWREFYAMILGHYPQVSNKSFKPAYDNIQWENNEEHFEKWKSGKTGYPMVDAGMRELLHTGYMHNRVRMITASFLCKHLLIDWRWGEAWFAEKLLDYELSSNNGGWQWSAGTGCDAAPYFRIFNPSEQQKKFDKEAEYTKRWVKELNTKDYPSPIIDHKIARERCLRTYKAALQ